MSIYLLYLLYGSMYLWLYVFNGMDNSQSHNMSTGNNWCKEKQIMIG